jgi:hypothetical protein
MTNLSFFLRIFFFLLMIFSDLLMFKVPLSTLFRDKVRCAQIEPKFQAQILPRKVQKKTFSFNSHFKIQTSLTIIRQL